MPSPPPSNGNPPPSAAGFGMPPEWVPHQGCLMAFPRRPAAHRGHIRAARANYAALAHAIAQFEPVTMICHPQDAPTAHRLLSADITLWELPIDDAWIRDSGPTYVANPTTGEIAGIDWLFNAWGNKYHPHDSDDAVAGAILRRQNKRRFLAPLVLEGGSIHTNGAGVLLTTEQCLLHRNRNPRLNRADIENLLHAHLGTHRTLWLKGDDRDTETDGHIDNIACFADETTLLYATDPQDPTLTENERRLKQATTPQNTPYTLVRLPRPTVRENGVDLLASYLNFYFANGGLVIPTFATPQDAEARAILSDLFPNRTLVSLPATDIVRGGGGIHCVTQQIPAPPTPPSQPPQ